MARYRYVQQPDGSLIEVGSDYREAPAAGYYIQADLQPYQSMATGEMIEGRRQHREMLKRTNCIEIGNEKQTVQERKPDPRLKEQLARLVYEKLRY
ncbi:MAG: hypothetical protein NTW48_10100 [Chloroflexi bacterium]|nr:hypothetical protein [Chloroflexota bacterium]